MTDDWDHDRLAAARAASPLSTLVPLAHALLGQAVRESGLLLLVTDPQGRLLWLDGGDDELGAADPSGFVAGTDWALSDGELSAIGRTLATRAPARSRATAAFPTALSATVVRDPRQGSVVGALAVGGGAAADDPFVLAALRGAASTLESHLATMAASPVDSLPVGSSSAHALLRLTGADAPTLDTAHGTSPLNRRHAEILAVLATATSGLDGNELISRVYSQPVSTVTLRAEIARLRRVLEETGALDSGVSLLSRPYRLLGVEDDATRVAAHLRRGALLPALNEYGGELLPGSEAPELVRRRTELSATLRGAVLGAGQTEALMAYLALEQGRDDVQAWQLALERLPAGSPRRAAALARLASLAG